MKFDVNSVLFYVGSIGFTVASFAFISSYGTTNLKAPQSIGGKYLLSPAVALDCFAKAPPMLVIGQSGTYLNGDLLDSEAKKDKLNRALKGNGALGGHIAEDGITLKGTFICRDKQNLAVEATIEAGQIQGKLRFGDQEIPFTGTKEKPKTT